MIRPQYVLGLVNSEKSFVPQISWGRFVIVLTESDRTIIRSPKVWSSDSQVSVSQYTGAVMYQSSVDWV
jgi:hypothetical protein